MPDIPQRLAAITGREPAVRAVAMPSDTNPSGDIFGGWLLSQMDLAAGTIAYIRAGGRVATAAVDAMSFHAPGLCRRPGELLRRGGASWADLDDDPGRGLGQTWRARARRSR